MLRRVLTNSEYEVAQMVHQCYTNKTIARKRSSRENTVNQHLVKIYNKLELSSKINPRVYLALLIEREINGQTGP